MKKSLFFIILSILMVAKSNAQSGFQVGIRYDPEFSGYQSPSDANAGDALQFKSHFTYLLSFGGGAIYNFDKNMGIGVDIMFSREGQAYSGTFNGTPPNPDTYSAVVARQISLNNIVITGDYVALAEINYIKVPLMFSLTTDNTRSLFFTVLVGPQFNFLHGIAQEVNEVDRDYPNTNITPMDLYKSFTLSAVLALGASYNLSSQLVLSARFRFDYGFNDAENKDILISYSGAAPVRFYSPDRSPVHTETAGLMVGLDFKL